MMRFGHAAWWGQDGFDARDARERERLRREFWHKARRVAARLPFAEDLLAAYYCAFDHATPMPVKVSLVGALAYFVLPFDALPDVFPLLGFTDDAAVLLTALRMVGAHMRPEHRDAARAALARIKKERS
ncbi:MAG TPA: YkvA family protein [Xanthobacteraceae bacterium]